ncbi:hypothetical protein LSH36_176g00022 [Paralvinella palmiformis]|uniref:DDE-1 domain-containing protein n=1 Tax=Paralvinella palmiformis TaxID=53620 RepID=A0AAD9JRQ9_9ANNE|nr:hypothetical protein LSH36_176g00022 [Paralvinella palmiformis]
MQLWHFCAIQSYLARRGRKATAIWNCYETGFTKVLKVAEVLSETGTRQVPKVSSGERGKNIAVLYCVGVAGSYISPLFVFPCKRMLTTLMNGAPAFGVVNEHGSGYIDGILFMKWLKQFVEISGCIKEHPHLFLLEGHESHKTLEAIDFSRDQHGDIPATLYTPAPVTRPDISEVCIQLFV